jgi:hypothetical protein
MPRRLGHESDHQHGPPVLVDDLAQEREYLVAGARVERSGRLIGEYDLGARDQRPRDRDPLLLAAREL